MLAVPALVVPLWWGWLFLLDGPHLFATWLRTYADPEERRRRPRLFAWSLLLVVPGLAAFALSKALGSSRPFDVFLLATTIWAFFHAVRQEYGILALYQRRAGADAPTRAFDSRFLTGSLWGSYLLFLVAHPWSRRALELPVEVPREAELAFLAGGAVLAAATLAYAARAVARRRAGLDVTPQLFVLGPVLAVQVFALFVVGGFEPLVPEPTNPEQYFLAAAVVGGLPHGAQYLGIVFFASRRRTVGKRPFAAYGVFLLLSIAYLALNAARGSGPAYAWFSVESDAARIFLALYWGLFLHHYWLDQYIWRVQDDPILREELGIA